MRVLIVAEGHHEGGGALESLVRRLSTYQLECDFERISQKRIHAHHGRGRGFLKRAIRWMKEAERRGYEALVLLIDEDGQSERIGEIERAQEDRLARIKRALGVAIRTFDAWILADEQALSTVLEISVGRQPSPETISDPKQVCTTLLVESDKRMNQSEMYAGVAETAEIGILTDRCPNGFAPFAERVRAL